MIQQNRLDSISPDLSRLFRAGSAVGRKNALLAACTKAVSDTDLGGRDVDNALEAINSELTNSDALAVKLNALAADFDERYFALSEDIEPLPASALALFQKARAAAALAFAVSGDPDERHDALYEAISATNDRIGMIQMAEEALKAR